jgi:hypothetical protein
VSLEASPTTSRLNSSTVVVTETQLTSKL